MDVRVSDSLDVAVANLLVPDLEGLRAKKDEEKKVPDGVEDGKEP